MQLANFRFRQVQDNHQRATEMNLLADEEHAQRTLSLVEVARVFGYGRQFQLRREKCDDRGA